MCRTATRRSLTVPQPPAPRQSNAWIWWLAGGCAVVVVLVIAGAALGAVGLKNRFVQGGFSCLPSSFPKYPGSSFAGENYTLNGATPGNACQVMFESNDSPTAVVDFYASRLDTGDWRVTTSDSTAGVVMFRSVKKARVTGTVSVAVHGSRTEVTVQLYS